MSEGYQPPVGRCCGRTYMTWAGWLAHYDKHCICPDEEGCSPADCCPIHDPVTEVVWAYVDEDVDW